MIEDVEIQHKFHDLVWPLIGCHENPKIALTKTHVSLGFSSLKDMGMIALRQKHDMMFLTLSILVPCTNW